MRCTISQIYLIKYSTCFGHVHCPSSGVSQHSIHAVGICHAEILKVGKITFKISAWQIPMVCILCWDTPDYGQWTCPKHVEYFIK